jgi:hypothetical protein
MKKIIHVMALPLHCVIRHKKHYIRFVLGSVVAFGGVIIAQMHFNTVPHLVIDCVGYGIHGVGFSNVLKVFNELLKTDL